MDGENEQHKEIERIPQSLCPINAGSIQTSTMEREINITGVG